MKGFHYKSNELHVDELPLEALASKYGTPLYVYSRSRLQQNYHAFTTAFGAVDHLICYALKANSNLSVLKVLAEMGCGADIVSGGELQRALTAGISPDK